MQYVSSQVASNRGKTRMVWASLQIRMPRTDGSTVGSQLSGIDLKVTGRLFGAVENAKHLLLIERTKNNVETSKAYRKISLGYAIVFNYNWFNTSHGGGC